jgi:predicted nucleotidyltransferase
MAESIRLQGLPDNVERTLSVFLTTARQSLSGDLISAVLFGSAAEEKLAPTSDVNLMLVLRGFVPERINKLRARSASSASA